MSPDEQALEEQAFKDALVGRTITGLRLEDVERGGDYERLTLETDRGPVILRSSDYEGYRSWIRLGDEE